MALRYDGSRLDQAERTSQGFLRVDGRMSRTGILPYQLGDGTTVREFRPPEEVFSQQSLDTARAGIPITLGHQGTITADNARTYKIGQTVTDGQPEDGRYLSAKLQIEDPQAIQQIDSGQLQELSAGYQVDIDPTPGVYQGQPYDAIQRNIRLNHVALLPPGQGRSGSQVGLRLDSADAVLVSTFEDSISMTVKQDAIKLKVGDKEHEMTKALADAFVEMQSMIDAATKSVAARDAKIAEQAAQLDALVKAATSTTPVEVKADSIEQKLGAQTARADLAEKRVQELEGQIRTDSEARSKDLDARVEARITLVDQARKILGREFKADGLSDRQVREAVLTKAGSRFDEKSSEDYVRGAFEVVTQAHAARGSIDGLAPVVVPPVPQKQDAKDQGLGLAEKARAEAIKRNAEAYKLKPAARN